MAFHFSARTSAIAALLLAAGCMSGEGTGSKTDLAAGNGSGNTITQAVTVTTLVSDQSGKAPQTATSLINSWGIVAYQHMFWVANNATGKVAIFDGAGMASKNKPISETLDLGEGITGVAVNDSTAMQISTDTECAPANLIFANENGQLIGVNTDLSTTKGFVLVDRSDVQASYLGVATIHAQVTPGQGSGQDNGSKNTGPVLTLAADFHNGRIDVFDESFTLVTDLSFRVADLPAGFAPFNVMVFDNVIYIAFAMQDETKTDEVAGAGLGLIAAFDVSGRLLWTAKGDQLNAPWGMALGHGAVQFGGNLAVGNFGDGHITLIDTKDGTILDQLVDASKAPVVIDGLWGLTFGVGVENAKPDGLYFAAGPEDEAHGMFGVITEVAAPTM